MKTQIAAYAASFASLITGVIISQPLLVAAAGAAIAGLLGVGAVKYCKRKGLSPKRGLSTFYNTTADRIKHITHPRGNIKPELSGV